MSTLTDLIRDRRGLKAIPNKPIKIGKTKRALDRKKDGAGEADDADDESKVHNDKVREKRRPVPQPRGSESGILPDQPCAMMYCGLSKSGKTTLLKETLKDKELLGGYFHTIVMMSPTADCDSTLTEALKLPKENVITDFEEEDLNKIIEAQRKLIAKKGYNKVAKTNRMLLIFDDCIAHQKFLRSKSIIDLTATVRHLLISVVFLIQSYRMVARACRINLRGIAFFQSNRNETDVLVEEECPPSLTTKQFRQLVHHATKERYSYLFINKDRPYSERYLLKYDHVLVLADE